MPRETIRKLSEDTDRLLVAGAHLAPGNADLQSDKAALGALITKLGAKSPPVFARLVEQIDGVASAKPKDQAAQLLALATSIAQVRAGLARLAVVVGADEPLAPAPDIQTPCNAKDLYTLHDALVTKGQGRMEKITEAVERGDVADLRLVHAVVQAMGDVYVGETVTSDVIPKFGRAIVDPVRKKLRFPGTKVDGRRLRALVAVEKQGARPLIDQAIREGSPEMRAAALEAIADHLPGVPELESVVLAILDKERSGEVRSAAVRALAGYGSEASFERLLKALDDARTASEAAEALGKSTHPKVVDRLAERLEQAVSTARAKVKKGDKTGEKARDFAKQLVNHLFRALGEHRDPRVLAIARDLLTSDFIPGWRVPAMVLTQQGTVDDHRAVADLLKGTNEWLFALAVEAAHKLPPEESQERFLAVLRAKDLDSKLGKARLSAVRSSEQQPAGEAWVKALLGLMKGTSWPAEAPALLAATKDERAYAPLMQLLEKTTKGDQAAPLIDALGVLGDKRAVRPILERVKSTSWSIGWSIRHAIENLADESSVAEVRSIYTSLKEPDASKNWHIRYLLRTLERKFPGS